MPSLHTAMNLTCTHNFRDQLWTNDGRYKSPEPGTEYPSELAVRTNSTDLSHNNL
jgi:hypothetical protein